MNALVELKNVTKTYSTGEREFRALDNVDLKLEKGKFVVILGPSGAGKSTLLNLIGGMDSPDEGTILVDGKDISNYKEDALSSYRARTVGFIFQFYNILPTLTVLENVALDSETGVEVLKLLMELCRNSGATVIIVTHNSLFVDIADTVVRVKNGKIQSVTDNALPKRIEEVEW